MNIQEKRKLKANITGNESVEEVIEMLEKVNTEIDLDGGTPLNHAANYDRNEIAEYLINRNANVNARHDGEYTPLMSACEGGNIELIKLLLDANADINVEDNHGNKALWKATFFEHEEAVELLLKAGADPFEEKKSGVTIYDAAIRMGKDSIVEIFDRFKHYRDNIGFSE